MLSVEQFDSFPKTNSILEKLKEQDQQLSLDIRLITAWIKEHKKGKLSSECKENRLWRKVSCQLHQHRSKLKTRQKKIRDILNAMTRNVEEFGTVFPELPDFGNSVLETEQDLANV